MPFEGEYLACFDAAVIVTDHDQVDYERLLRFSKLVLDTRNRIAARPQRETRAVLARA